MTARTDILLTRAEALVTLPAEDRRRERLIERAVAAGHAREYADRLYDIATEENVDPALAFELVLAGVGVRELAHGPSDSSQETQVEAAPAWVTHDAVAPRDAARERLARTTFRRLQRIRARATTSEAAIRHFVREPDVGDVEY